MKDKQLLLAIMALLEREKTVSVPQLATMLDVAPERLYDALGTLVFAYDAASIRLDLHDTYATLQTYGSSQLLRLTPLEVDVLVNALTTAGFSAGDELFGALLEAKAVLSGSGEETCSRLSVTSDQNVLDVVQTLALACEDPEHHIVEIAYLGTDDIEPQIRRVEALRIFSEDSHKYLQAYCLDAQDWRTFRVDRVASARMLEERFSPRSDAPAAVVCSSGFPGKARIALDRDCPLPSWRGMRVIRELDDGGRIVSVPWTEGSWLPKHIVALMGKAVPLEPEGLRVACLEYARNLI